MLIVAATMHPLTEAIDLPTVLSWTAATSPERPQLRFIDNSIENVGIVASYQEAYEETTEPIIAYLHTDVEIFEPNWDQRVLREFDDPSVGVVGFGGALRLGSPYLYKRPYDFRQLARFGYRSNAVDAEIHGERLTDECDAAVLDGYAIIVRRELLDKAKGWPVGAFDVHCYDTWLACMATRLGYRTRVVGVKCQHYSAGKAVGDKYARWLEAQGKSDADFHQEGHRYIYSEFRDVLPLEVKC